MIAWQMQRNVCVALQQKKWLSLSLKDPRGVWSIKWSEQLLAQTWNLLCFPRYFWDFYTHTYIFSSLTFSILNQIVSDCKPAKTSCKTVWTKVNPAAKVFMYFENSREVNEQVNLWKQRLRYSIVRNETIFLTGKKSVCEEAGEIFSLG